jgi:class 3 adenylate cyclase
MLGLRAIDRWGRMEACPLFAFCALPPTVDDVRPQTQYAHGQDGVVAYQVTGEGPDLIHIPGWFSNIEVAWEDPSYARFLDHLASFSRLICFDKRGTGISDPVPLNALPNLEQWMDDVLLVMDAVESRRAAMLGWDVGGSFSMLFAATYPERTSHLVLVDSWAALKRDETNPIGIPRDAYDWFIATMEGSFGESSEPSYLSLAAPSAHTDRRFREWFGRFERLSATPTIASAFARTTYEWDLRHVLKSIQTPTLILSHQNQLYIRPDHGRYLAAHIPSSRYIDLPSRDSLMYRGDADTIVNEVRAFVTGVREAVESDRVLATVLFTDIVGSTGRAAEVGDHRWRELLDAHDALVRSRIVEFRGREVKTTGDGVLATFDGPARAIRSATAISRDVRDLGIEIKAGLHTGEVEVRGEDIGGIAVHTAARVMAAAAPGEVLISRTVKDLVAGSGIEFEDRGAHELKGVPGEWALYSVRDE